MLKQETTITNESGNTTTRLAFDQDTGVIEIEQTRLDKNKTRRNVVTISTADFFQEDVTALAEMFEAAVVKMWCEEDVPESWAEEE